uniref:Solute carrier family 22 member 8 n=1 Tax=Lynx canadensis TaxID=61383 RepID=A0A667J1B3_LYNCA
MALQCLLDQDGGLGRFQILQIIFLCISSLIVKTHILLENFTAAIPGHCCWVHILHNDTVSANSTGIFSQEVLLRISIPLDSNTKPEKCHRFIHPQGQFLHLNACPTTPKGGTEPCLDDWAYDPSTTDSIVTEWDFAGVSSKLKEVAQSLFVAGTVIGGTVPANLSDSYRFGRKLTLTGSYLLLAASGSCAAFSPNLHVDMIFSFLSGCSVERVSIQMWAILSTLLGYVYTGGPFFLTGLAYPIRQWLWLQLTVSIPFFAFFLSSWWIPESVRWMVPSGKFSKALKILWQVTALNGKKEEEEKLTVEELKRSLQKEISLAKAKYSVADLFRTPDLCRVTFCLSLAWFSTGFAYYSLAMSVAEFGVNLCFLQLIFGGVDFPAKFIHFLSINHLGQHSTLASGLLLAGGCILALIFVPSGEKGCLSSSFSCLFLCSSELYPTVIRPTGMSIGNLGTHMGSMMAPLVKITGEWQPFIPKVIFGTITFLGGRAALFLPETLNQPWPETIEDVETWSVPCFWSSWNS